MGLPARLRLGRAAAALTVEPAGTRCALCAAASLSFDELAARAGVPAPRLEPGDVPMDTDLAWALYWPGVPPGFQPAPLPDADN